MSEGLPPQKNQGDAMADQRRLFYEGSVDTLETLKSRHPALLSNDELLVDLIYAEYRHREELGIALPPEIYLARFPQLRSKLEPLFEVHQAMAGSVSDVALSPTSSQNRDDKHREFNTEGSISSQLLRQAKQRIGVQTVTEFAEAITQIGLMSSEELSNTLASVGHLDDSDVKSLAKALFESRKLTLFQVRILLSGRNQELVLGDYLLVDKLGEGGMGQVFKAIHRRMRRMVALKMLPIATMQSPEAIKRFQREVHAAAKLTHPNIVTAYDAGETSGVHYLVMEYIEGIDLSRLVKTHGRMKHSQTLDCLIQVCMGLEHAHVKGLVHRDIKPSNLLIDKDGVVKILDLGLARTNDERDDELTPSDSVMGTVDYMAPEQALDTKHADARSDIYSLGCTLYYLLTAQKPFDADTVMKKLLAHREAPIPQIHQHCADVPVQFQDVFERMVAKRPIDRFQTVNELRTEFESLRLELESCTSASKGADGANRSESLSISGRSETAGLKAFLDGLRTSAPSTVETTLPQVAFEINTNLETNKSDTQRRQANRSTQTRTVNSESTREKHFVSRASKSRTPQKTRTKKKLQYYGLGVVVLAALVWPVISALNAKKSPTLERENTTGIVPAMIQHLAPPPANAPFNKLQAQEHQKAWAKYCGVELVSQNSLGMQFVVIPPGTFMMGATNNEILVAHSSSKSVPEKFDRETDIAQQPKHRVTLTHPFLMATTETTVKEFGAFATATEYKTLADTGVYLALGWRSESEPAVQGASFNWRNPGYAQTDNYPVGCITWADAAEFCNWLSVKENLPPCYVKSAAGIPVIIGGIGYRLPTEAEWEYACRAGTTTIRFWGDDPQLKQLDMYSVTRTANQTLPVSSRVSNPFGLYDMLGNAGEWCQDYYAVDYYNTIATGAVDPMGPTAAPGGEVRVFRGVNGSGADSTASYRGRRSQPVMVQNIGFRVVRTLEPAK